MDLRTARIIYTCTLFKVLINIVDAPAFYSGVSEKFVANMVAEGPVGFLIVPS